MGHPSSNIKDMTGQVINGVKVIKRADNTKFGTTRWLCECKCGNTFITAGSSLRKGDTKSCGCHRLAALRKQTETTRTHGMTGTALYRTWSGMIQRCTNPNIPEYHRYGGRGITVCDEWRDAKTFIEWALKNGYEDGLTIERIDNDGNYTPENCMFATRAQQNRNKTGVMHLMDNSGNKYTGRQAAKIAGVSSSTVTRWCKEYNFRTLEEICDYAKTFTSEIAELTKCPYCDMGETGFGTVIKQAFPCRLHKEDTDVWLQIPTDDGLWINLILVSRCPVCDKDL